MKRKLLKTLGSDIIITNIQGKGNVTFQMTVEKILDHFWKTERIKFTGGQNENN